MSDNVWTSEAPVFDEDAGLFSSYILLRDCGTHTVGPFPGVIQTTYRRGDKPDRKDGKLYVSTHSLKFTEWGDSVRDGWKRSTLPIPSAERHAALEALLDAVRKQTLNYHRDSVTDDVRAALARLEETT